MTTISIIHSGDFLLVLDAMLIRVSLVELREKVQVLLIWWKGKGQERKKEKGFLAAAFGELTKKS